MKVFICVLLAVAAQAAPKADPAVVYSTYGLPYGAHPLTAYAAPAVATYAAAVVPKVETEVTATNQAVPVSVGGYKAVAGDNGDLKGAVHEVPAVFGAPALNTQVNAASQGSLTVGTGAVVTSKVTGYNTVPVGHYFGKREAEADPAVFYSGFPYAAHPLTAYAAPAVATYAAAVVPKVETEVTATNQAVPVSVGGYKAVAGDNGDLKGAVHEVPAVFGAPALNTQVNAASQGSLTVGTGAVVTSKVTGYNTVPVGHYIGKREAEADPAVFYSGLPYAAHPLTAYTAPAVATYAAAVVPKVETEVTATNQAVPVSVGGYKAVAGDNGDLKGAVHEVPAVFGAPALNTQVNAASQGSLTVGTGAVVTSKVTGYNTVPVGHYFGKREAEADPAVFYSGLPYAAHPLTAYAAPAVATYAAAVVPKVETEVTATNQAVPVSVGGYKAVAGDNGDLKGAVHEVPAVFGAPALNTQVNAASQGSLTVGTGAVVTAKVTGYNTVPVGHYFGKREAEADPAVLYSTYGYTAPATLGYSAPATFGYSVPATYGYSAYNPYRYSAYGYAGYPLY